MILVERIDPVTEHEVRDVLVVVKISNVLQPIDSFALTIPMRVSNPIADATKGRYARIGELDAFATDGEGVRDVFVELGLDGVFVVADVVLVHGVTVRM
jgi:hypothetical protein